MTFEKIKTEKSKGLYELAIRSLAGGVGSIARGPHSGFKPYPLYIEHGKGSRIFDVDGNEYIDYLLALGPLILGHASPIVIDHVKNEIEKGTMYAAPYEQEFMLAEKLVRAIPSFELATFANSGTEAVQGALRTARAYSGNDKVVKFEGHYHGWVDNLAFSQHPPIQAAGLPEHPRPVPLLAGIPESVQKDIIVLPWNDLSALEKAIRRHGNEIAAVIMEPINCNTGVILPEKDYLKEVRRVTEDNDIVLIFDEIITGFRIGMGGAQEYFRVTPDLTTVGKALGSGFPISAFGGKKEIMDLISDGKVLHAGTYNSNRVAVAAAYAVLNHLEENSQTIYKHLHSLGTKLINDFGEILEDNSIEAIVQGLGPMFQIYFTPLKEIRNYREAATADPELFFSLRQHLLTEGVFIHPNRFECWFLSTEHTEKDVEQTVGAFETAIKELMKDGKIAKTRQAI